MGIHPSFPRLTNFVKNSLILVDSTRSGKKIPDALSKTVPIWCAVINRAHLIRSSNPRQKGNTAWDTKLYTPPSTVSRQEHDQIEQRLDGWAKALAVSVRLVSCTYLTIHLSDRFPPSHCHRCRVHLGPSGSLLPTPRFLNLMQSRPTESTFSL